MQKADQLKAEVASISELLRNGRPERAFKRATKAAKKWPNVAALPRLAGLCAVQQRKSKLAQTYFERAWRLDPGNSELIQNYGLSLVQGGDAEAALQFLAKIGARGPLTPPQQFIRAMALLHMRELENALAAVDLVLKGDPANLNAKCLRADILDEMHQWDRAIDVLSEVVRQHPKFQHGQLRMAKAQLGMGHLDEALKYARAALALTPGHSETIEMMATLPNLTQDDVSTLRTQISQSLDGEPAANPEETAKIHFAAATLARLDQDTTQEMTQLSAAHTLLRDGFKSWEDRSAQECAKRLAAPLPVASGEAHTNISRPVFVVGLPRSGTTLVERILARHSDVHGFGELASVQQWVRQAETQPPAWRAAHSLADFYVEKLPNLPERAAAFVDKAPGNYAFLGEIARAFPNAIILNVLRDPRDIALSMWRANFGAGGLYYTHDLKWMAAEANRYRRYMLHWHNVLPGRIHDIRYEMLVHNVEDTAKQLARICDLPFQDSMLSPDKSPNAIKTASNLQARKPVNTSSIGAWQVAADQLAPFVKNLDADLWPDIKGQ
ncbi:tetratricopeptide repeat-containing sulfotransferase family protein [Ruegeria halocynthiae]|uniref:tetratricopeptide repeat-containing sulfotransferase family protein n=1 Tax=Ruegeria halocynthiae TaxID=985054 RepID=UPI000A49F9F8|nr:sulfotransferase [Ruegeria halocynthiae]